MGQKEHSIDAYVRHSDPSTSYIMPLAPGHVHDITSSSALDAAQSEAAKANKLVLIDYFADWCGPCRMIAPKLHDFAKQYTNVLFLKVPIATSPQSTASSQLCVEPDTCLVWSNM